ncbi:hypothetical protein ACFYE2_05715 [Kocuria sp. CPCC 205300]|uniref:hypothetical protein n=1 Tax=Kocuria sabuli TaxID=3071448 RepID=UPI0036DDD880
MYFRHTATTDRAVDQAVDAVYALAGLELVDRSKANSDALLRRPTAAALAYTLADEAIDAEDPEEFARSAAARLAEAAAIDAIRENWYAAQKNARADRRPELIAGTIEDTRHMFDKAVEDLTSAVEKLDGRQPMSTDPLRSTSTATTTLEALIAARQALGTLSKFASLTRTEPHDQRPAGLATLLRVIAIDGVVQEAATIGTPDDKRTVNEEELEVTRAVRRLAEDYLRDRDNTVARIAAGHYPGVTLRLNTAEELEAVRGTIGQAIQPKWVSGGEAAQHGENLDARRAKLKADGRAARARAARGR